MGRGGVEVGRGRGGERKASSTEPLEFKNNKKKALSSSTIIIINTFKFSTRFSTINMQDAFLEGSSAH